MVCRGAGGLMHTYSHTFSCNHHLTLCTCPSVRAASIGRPNGLTRNATTSRITPLPVIFSIKITPNPRMVKNVPASPNTHAVIRRTAARIHTVIASTAIMGAHSIFIRNRISLPPISINKILQANTAICKVVKDAVTLAHP